MQFSVTSGCPVPTTFLSRTVVPVIGVLQFPTRLPVPRRRHESRVCVVPGGFLPDVPSRSSSSTVLYTWCRHERFSVTSTSVHRTGDEFPGCQCIQST